MRTLWIALALGGVALTAGCAGGYGTYSSYGYSDGYGGGGLYADVYTTVRPPAPLVEVVPPQPGPGYAWINGYWSWNGNQYVWQRGHWDVRPRDRVWVRHGWVRRGDRYVYVPGRWMPRGRRYAIPYVDRYPGVRYGDRYAVIPYGRWRENPYARVPREYWYRGVPRARAYVVP